MRSLLILLLSWMVLYPAQASDLPTGGDLAKQCRTWVHVKEQINIPNARITSDEGTMALQCVDYIQGVLDGIIISDQHSSNFCLKGDESSVTFIYDYLKFMATSENQYISEEKSRAFRGFLLSERKCP